MAENVGKNINDDLKDTIIISGHLQDIVKKDGSEENLDMGNNQICIGCHTLIAYLIGGKSHDDVDGDLYFAIGSGTNNPSSSDESLDNFLFKHKINTNNGDKIEISGNTLSLTAIFPLMPTDDDIDNEGKKISSALYNSQWSECGIYKGKTLLNRKVHTLVEKTSETEIIRTFKFTF